LARMEADGLVTHTASGGRKVYEITEAGKAELERRSAELEELEAEIHATVADLAALAEQVEGGVRGSVRNLKRELREARTSGLIREEWRSWRGAWAPGASAAPEGDGSEAARKEVERRAHDLAAEVGRLVRLGRASREDLRVAAT